MLKDASTIPQCSCHSLEKKKLNNDSIHSQQLHTPDEFLRLSEFIHTWFIVAAWFMDFPIAQEFAYGTGRDEILNHENETGRTVHFQS